MQNEDECQHIASLRYGDFVFTIEMPMTIIGRRNTSFEPDIDLNLFGWPFFDLLTVILSTFLF